jgi:hypothetical protein
LAGVSNLEGMEGQVGRISMINLCAQESAYLKHQQAMESVSKSGSGGGGGSCGKYQYSGYRTSKKKKNNKGKKKGGLSKTKDQSLNRAGVTGAAVCTF